MTEPVTVSIKQLSEHNLLTGPSWYMVPHEHIIISMECDRELIIHGITPGSVTTNWMSDVVDVYGKIHCFDVNQPLVFRIYTDTGADITTFSQLIPELGPGEFGCSLAPVVGSIVVINSVIVAQISMMKDITVTDIHNEYKQYDFSDEISAKIFM